MYGLSKDVDLSFFLGVAGGTALLGLLHVRVSRATATEAGGLSLDFETNVRVTVFDDSQQYESFWIAHGDGEIIV